MGRTKYFPERLKCISDVVNFTTKLCTCNKLFITLEKDSSSGDIQANLYTILEVVRTESSNII